jgi:acyl CoA:acetate/3-ketoacid CoA transferase alpha subunit
MFACRASVRDANVVAEILPLSEAVAALVHDGNAVALEGFTHLIPFAAGHEVLRRRGGYGLATICIGVGQGLAVVLHA